MTFLRKAQIRRLASWSPSAATHGLSSTLCRTASSAETPPLEALADRAGVLVEELEAKKCEVSYQHVRREFDVEADKLSNDAMDIRSSSLNHTADFAY